MNAIRILLEDMAGQAWPDPASPGDPYLLQIDSDVVIAVQEDEDGSHIHLCSRPGYLYPVDWLDDHAVDGAWSTTAHDADTEPGVARTLCIEQPDGRVLLRESWPRALLDKVRFAERLSYFTELTRWWQRMLVAEPEVAANMTSLPGLDSTQPTQLTQPTQPVPPMLAMP